MRILAALFLLAACVSATATQLRTSGTSFSIDEKEVFLLGCSYYSALGASETNIQKDLDDLQKLGFNWVRVWATWSSSGTDISAVDAAGNVRQPYMNKLAWLVRECDRRKMIVDVTLTRGSPGIQTLQAHQHAIQAIDQELKSLENWYFDLSNERDVRDKRFSSIQDIKQLREWLAQADPQRLVSASHGGDIDQRQLRDDVMLAGLSFVSIHRPRDAASPHHTAATTRQLFAWMKELHREVPMMYDEPFRRGYGKWQPAAEDFLEDLKQAQEAGAAGWCFHNGAQANTPGHLPGRSFDLRKKRLIDQLDPEEMKFLAALKQRQG